MEPDNTPGMESAVDPPPPVKLVTFTRYDDAQAAVDTLSDRGFPVSSVSIVWSGLRRIEHVTGRRTVVSAAAEGAIAGAWFGTLFGLLLALLVDLPEGSSVAGVAFTYFLVGAVAGALWTGGTHALRRGRRDFSMIPQLDAERYELWVHPDNHALASDLLNLGSSAEAGRQPAPGGSLPADPPSSTR